MKGKSQQTVYTVGHSTRSLDEFVSLMKNYGVELVVDVRTVPRSRHNPQFNKETLPNVLKTANLKYVHIPELGGLRRPKADSINMAWESKSFRGYADYMQTKDFAENLLKLVALIQQSCVAIMCAEAVPWRCHRNLLADALLVRGIKVSHILTETGCTKHELTSFAKVDGNSLTYPLFVKEKSQRSLSDFGASEQSRL
ncbi:MAG TPA: DUF488 domain-containing protein [Candidatus Nanoarchaeia archaeon]|nr:DUF488 domain-containing protein [Candidatus Nanoarchaeia archaeon]